MKIEKYLNKKHFLKVAILLPILINLFYLLFVNFVPISNLGMAENFYYIVRIQTHYPNIDPNADIDLETIEHRLGVCPFAICEGDAKFKDLDISKLTQDSLNGILATTDYALNLDKKRCGLLSDIKKEYPDSKIYTIEYGYLYNSYREFPGYSSNLFKIKIRINVAKTAKSDEINNLIIEQCNIQDPNFKYSLDSKLKFYGK